MRRYTYLLLAALLFILSAVAGTAYLSSYADKADNDDSLPSLSVYTTLPAENAALLAAEYEKSAKVRLNFIPMSAAELSARLANPNDAGSDVVLAGSQTMCQAAANGTLAVYLSEEADSVPEELRDKDGYWTGVWYDPMVFCANKDFLQNAQRIPRTWDELTSAEGVRIGITDFLAADASANLFFALEAQYGAEQTAVLLRHMQPKVVQYAKYLSTPVRMAGMREVDISVAVQSEVLRYINDGYPLVIIYPSDGTSYELLGAGVQAGSKKAGAAQSFCDWLLGDEVQILLQKNGFYFVPANPATQAAKRFAGNYIALFDHQAAFSAVQRHELLDSWVKNIRIR